MQDLDAGSSTSGHELIVSARIDAPRERVFDAFTDRAHIGQWWGPNGFTTTIHEMEVVEGGVWRFMMHGPDGTDYPNRIDYVEVKRPARLCYEHGDDASPHFRTEVTFEEQGGATVVRFHLMCRTQQQLDDMKKFGAVEGGNQTLERLGRYLAGYGSEM
jgi:uncharacterized protein YndB with AHSA1/START domain